MTNNNKEIVDSLINFLNNKKEKAPIRYKVPVDVEFVPEQNIKLAVDNTKIKYKKGLI